MPVIAVALGGSLLVAPAYTRVVTDAASASPVVAAVGLISLKATTIFFPVLPGSVVGLVGIPVFGWVRAMIYDAVGAWLGALVAFLAVRRARARVEAELPRLVAYLRPAGTSSRFAVFGRLLILRLFTEPIFDLVSLAVGVWQISVLDYMLATMVGSMPARFFIFYMGGAATTQVVAAVAVFAIVVMGTIAVFRARRGTH